MKDILDELENYIAAIRDLQLTIDFHSKRLEKLMESLHNHDLESSRADQTEGES